MTLAIHINDWKLPATAAALALSIAASTARASTISGDVYYTKYTNRLPEVVQAEAQNVSPFPIVSITMGKGLTFCAFRFIRSWS